MEPKSPALQADSLPAMYNLNQIPYEYAVELVNRFKGLDLVNSVPEELWREVHNTCAVQFSSVAQLCPTLRDPMNRSTPGLSITSQ